MSSPVSAANIVISTPELLETILLNLSMQDLLLHALLVSHSFHVLICSSPALQQHLFFLPKAPSRPSDYLPNPLLVQKFSPFFQNLQPSPRHHSKAEPVKPPRFHFINIQQLEGRSAPEFNSSWTSNPLAFRRKEASWRRMLVLQPPVEKAIIVNAEMVPVTMQWKLAREMKDFSSNTTLDAGEGMEGGEEKTSKGEGSGLRMGWLYDHAAEGLGKFCVLGLQCNIFDDSGFKQARSQMIGGDMLRNEESIGKPGLENSMTLVWRRVILQDTRRDVQNSNNRMAGNFLSLDFRSVGMETGSETGSDNYVPPKYIQRGTPLF